MNMQDYLDVVNRYVRRQGAGLDAATSLATGMAAQVPAGLAGIGRFGIEALRGAGLEAAASRAADSVRRSTDALTYEPRTAGGQQYVGNIGSTLENVENKISDSPGGRAWQDFTVAAPGTAAAIAGIASVAGPGKAKPKPKPRGLKGFEPRAMSPEDAKAAVLRGEHIIPKPGEGDTGFTGAPRNIRNMADLEANRARMDQTLGESAARIEDAGEVVGDWYPSQRRGVSDITDPWNYQRTAEGTALMSSQAQPRGERNFLIQAHNRLSRGEDPGVVHTGRQGREYAQSQGVRRIKLGNKTGNYALLSDPGLPPTIFGTNDFRQAQFHGYTSPQGKPQTAGLGETQHKFLDAEGLLLTMRANALRRGGRTDWTGQMTQEVPWIAEKANALMKRSPAKYPDTPEGRRAAIQEASKTGEDANWELAAGANYERLPGRSTGHDVGILDEPFNVRRGYGNDPEASWINRSGRDKIYDAFGLLQLPTRPGVGIWENRINPNFTAMPLGDTRTYTGGRTAGSPTSVKVPEGIVTDPGFMQQLALAENMRGLADVQEASTAHVPRTEPSRKKVTQTHALLEHEGALSAAEMRALAANLPPGYMPTPTPRGTMLMNFEHGPQRVRQDVAAMQDPIGQGQLNLTRTGMDSTGLIPVYARQPGNAPQIPIAPNKGIVTARFLRRAARSPEESVTRLGESEDVRSTLKGIHARNAMREVLGHTIRDDVQKSVRFFSEADWPKVVAMLRQNPKLKVGAAMAALGYSLQGMADEEVPR